MKQTNVFTLVCQIIHFRIRCQFTKIKFSKCVQTCCKPNSAQISAVFRCLYVLRVYVQLSFYDVITSDRHTVARVHLLKFTRLKGRSAQIKFQTVPTKLRAWNCPKSLGTLKHPENSPALLYTTAHSVWPHKYTSGRMVQNSVPVCNNNRKWNTFYMHTDINAYVQI